MNYLTQMRIKIQDELNLPDINDLFLREKELEEKEIKIVNMIREITHREKKIANKEEGFLNREKELRERENKLKDDELILQDKINKNLNKEKELENALIKIKDNLEPDMPKIMNFNESVMRDKFHDTTEYIIYNTCNIPHHNLHPKLGICISNKGKIHFGRGIGSQYSATQYYYCVGDLKIKMTPIILEIILNMTTYYGEIRNFTDFPLVNILYKCRI
jgi:hypothetical protein